MGFFVEMNDYLPINCSKSYLTPNFYKDYVDFFSMHNITMYIRQTDNTISILYWYSNELLGYLSTRKSTNGREIALTSQKINKQITKLNGHDISTGIVIPESVNSFMTSDTLILFANRYSVEVSLDLNKWIPFE